jgi:hypothetical protein
LFSRFQADLRLKELLLEAKHLNKCEELSFTGNFSKLQHFTGPCFLPPVVLVHLETVWSPEGASSAPVIMGSSFPL